MLNQTFNFVYFQSIEEVLHKKLGMNLKQKNQTKRKHKHTLFAQDRSDANPNEWTKKKSKASIPLFISLTTKLFYSNYLSFYF